MYTMEGTQLCSLALLSGKDRTIFSFHKSRGIRRCKGFRVYNHDIAIKHTNPIIIKINTQ